MYMAKLRRAGTHFKKNLRIFQFLLTQTRGVNRRLTATASPNRARRLGDKYPQIDHANAGFPKRGLRLDAATEEENGIGLSVDEGEKEGTIDFYGYGCYN